MHICLWCNSIYETIPESGECPMCGYDKFSTDMNFETEHVECKSALIKLGYKETLEYMRQGSIWFQSPKYYQNFKGNSAICDIHECAFDYIGHIPEAQYEKIKRKILGKTFMTNKGEMTVKEIEAAYVAEASNSQNYNRLLCFYLLKGNDMGVIERPSEKIQSFGDSFCFVNYRKLNDEIRCYAEQNNIYSWFCGVKYVTDNYNGPYNPTFKDISYAYQNEHRFIMRGRKLNDLDEMDPLRIHIDCAEDIFTEAYPMEWLFTTENILELFEKCGLSK